MSKLSHYRAAFYLSILSGVTTLILFGLLIKEPVSMVFFYVAALVIPFGLWLASNFVRGLGAAYLVITAGGLLWVLVSSGALRIVVSSGALWELVSLNGLWFVLVVFLAGINLLTVALLLSNQFATEWAKEREQQPTYKSYLRSGLLYAVIGAALIATYNMVQS